MRTYVHDENTSFVKFLDCPLGRNTDGADEELSPLFDDDINEVRKLTLGVVVL